MINYFLKVYHNYLDKDMNRLILIALAPLIMLASCGQGISDSQKKDYLLGRKFSMENKHAEALRLLSGVYEENPDYPQNAYLYGKMLFVSGETEKAVRIWESVHEKHPYFADNARELGRYYLSAGEPDRAEELIRKALEWDGSDPVLLTLLARVYSQKKDYEKALNLMVQADGRLETMAEIPLEYARLLQSYGFYHKAAESVEKAIALSGPESSLIPALAILKERLENEID